MKILVLILATLAIGIVSAGRKKCKDKKILTFDSQDRDWFHVSLDPPVKGAINFDKLLYGDWKNDNSFFTPVGRHQMINIRAKDNSSFRLLKVEIKVTKSDAVRFLGFFKGGREEEINKQKGKKHPTDGPWKRLMTKGRSKRGMKTLQIKIYKALIGFRDRWRKIFFTDLRVLVCVD